MKAGIMVSAKFYIKSNTTQCYY